MKNIFKNTLLAISIGLISTQSIATPNGFHSSGELGYSKSTGNTNVLDVKTKLNAELKTPKYKLKSMGSITFRSDSGVTDTENYYGESQLDWNLPYKNTFAFGEVQLEQDKLVGIDLDSYYLGGIGYNFVDINSFTLKTQISVGYQKTTYTQQESVTQFIVKPTAKLEFKIKENVLLIQDFSIYQGNEQLKYKSDTQIKFNVDEHISLKLNYLWKHNNNPAINAVKDDIETFFTIMYEF